MMESKPGRYKQTGGKMQPGQENRKEIMEDAPTAFESLEGIGQVEERFKKHKQSQAHKL
jgi:hypothetical protein